jgi:hypothetical protein
LSGGFNVCLYFLSRGWEENQLFVSVLKFLGIGNLKDIKEITVGDDITERNMLSNVDDFDLRGSFLFASSRRVVLTFKGHARRFCSRAIITFMLFYFSLSLALTI